jgi:hypothetical protein
VTFYADLADYPEDQRVEQIGHQAITNHLTVGFIVETEAKAKRYIEKLERKFPGIRIIHQGKGPVPGAGAGESGAAAAMKVDWIVHMLAAYVALLWLLARRLR